MITGADSTSIDRGLIEKLGYGPELLAYDQFISEQMIGVDTVSFKRGEAGKFADELTEKVKSADIGIEKIVAVYSSHGLSFRPYIRLSLKLSGKRFETLTSIYDRSKLAYSMIVGRKSLYYFLINPAK